MRLGVVADLIAHARVERESATIFQFGVQLPFEAEQNMTLPAPMIGHIARAVLNQANPYFPKLASAPIRRTGLAWISNASIVDQSVVAKGIAVSSMTLS